MKTQDQIEREAEQEAAIIWPYPGEHNQRELIKLGYMRAYNKMFEESVVEQMVANSASLRSPSALVHHALRDEGENR